jgi:hypothetical protein
MTKLRVELGQYHELVFGRILEQPESLRRIPLREAKAFVATNGFKLRSYDCSQLRADVLYVRGFDDRQDHRVFRCVMQTSGDAARLIAQIHQAVREFNETQALTGAAGTIPLTIAE